MLPGRRIVAVAGDDPAVFDWLLPWLMLLAGKGGDFSVGCCRHCELDDGLTSPAPGSFHTVVGDGGSVASVEVIVRRPLSA
jgi:hypothetical protein